MKTRLMGRLMVYKEVEHLPLEWVCYHPTHIHGNTIYSPTLSKEARTKIAMLDLMNHHEELPCGSKKVEYTTFTSYWIYSNTLKYRPVRRNGGV